MNLRATYRLQFNRGFTFADAERMVPYLDRLGISHIYASPVTVAQPGSMHGYDVIDPTRINPELGGEEGLRRLVSALRAHDMGLIIDIVPNHMSVIGGTNAWWMDVLAKGQRSAYARFFDIDWREKILLPFLGEPLDEALAKGALELRREQGRLWIVAYGHDHYPVREEDQEGGELRALLESQHYRLADWRRAGEALNWRRFFTITELAGVRVEDEQVFEATHALYFRLHAEGLIDGVRVDHVDGLTDPAGYCRRLRERLPGAYIIVEKILAAGEPLPQDWRVDGTSGYDFMEQVSALLHAPEGEAPLGEYWARLSGRSAAFEPQEFEARQEILASDFQGQLAACARAFGRLASGRDALTEEVLRRAIERMLWVFPVYRTYGTGRSAPATDRRTREMVRERALPLAQGEERDAIEAILTWLAGEGPGDAALAAEAVRRFQQLSAPIAAKAVEDTAFYRYGRLLSRNDVGFDPARFSMTIADFHAAMANRRAQWPRAMLATATHDHKRGGDVRARLAVLSELPDEWIAAVDRWEAINAGLGAGVAVDDRYQCYQMLVGAWPSDDAAGDFGDRLAAWLEKAVREARLRSSWTNPNQQYESHCKAFVAALLNSPEFLTDAQAFIRRIAPAGEANALVQAFLRCTAPGIPDLYQGCEFADLSLVDPDNRRPVDFDSRIKALDADGKDFDSVKQALIARLLRLRRDHPELWDEGTWEPVEVGGPRADHIVAFRRRHADACLWGAALLRCGRELVRRGDRVPERSWWGETRTDFEATSWAADLLSQSPVHVSVHSRR